MNQGYFTAQILLLYFFTSSYASAQTSQPADWLPPTKTFAKPKLVTHEKAKKLFTQLANLPCIPVKRLKLDDYCIARAHAMWGVLNRKSIYSQKIWALTDKNPRRPSLWLWREPRRMYLKKYSGILHTAGKMYFVEDHNLSEKLLPLEEWKKKVRFRPKFHTISIDRSSKKVWIMVKPSTQKKRLWIEVLYQQQAIHWNKHVAILITTTKGHFVIDPATSNSLVSIQEWKRAIHFDPLVHSIAIVSGRRYSPPQEKGQKKPDLTKYGKLNPFRDDVFKYTKLELWREWYSSGLHLPSLEKRCNYKPKVE